MTAVVFAVVMLAGLFINGFTFITLFVIICLGCSFETIKITRLIKPNNWHKFLPLALLYAFLPIILMIDLGFNLSFLPFITRGKNLVPYSFILPVAVVLSIWINDTMAYIVGSMIGKTPFSKISPKKTWEGTIGGAILCVLVMGLIGLYLPVSQGLELKHWVAIATVAAVAGTLGDLFESKLKRMANIKDSGTFMPGHGGFLDRFDSLLFTAPLVWLYMKLFVL